MKRGDHCVWTFVPRGGYGFAITIDVRIAHVGRKRVQIVAPLKGGGTKLVWVRRESLTAKEVADVGGKPS